MTESPHWDLGGSYRVLCCSSRGEGLLERMKAEEMCSSCLQQGRHVLAGI